MEVKGIHIVFRMCSREGIKTSKNLGVHRCLSAVLLPENWYYSITIEFVLINCYHTINNNWYNSVIVYESSSNRTENPCVGGSIPPLSTSNTKVLGDLRKQ